MDSRTERPHRRGAVAAVTVVLGAALLSGCAGDDPYCQAVEKGRSSLDSFGSTRSDAAFARHVRTLTSITAVAPAATEPDWKRLTEVTQGVVTAHREVGFPLQDMSDADKRSSLSAGDIERLNKAYDAFNDTADERKAVVADVAKQCDITLR